MWQDLGNSVVRSSFDSKLLLYFYDEESQDIDRVLDIFVRVNSAVQLSRRVSLLMSIATARWMT